MSENQNSEQKVAEETPAAEAVAKKGNFWGKVDNYFGITKSGSSFKVEVIAGLTTFMTMVYILMVNAGMFSAIPGLSYGAAYIATAIGAIVGTLLIGILGKLPMAQAPGMGVNAFFVFTICLTFGFTYANTLVFTLLDGIIFIILTTTGLRQQLFKAIPDAVKVAIPAGIGLFIAFIGLQNAGIVVADGATLVKLVSLNLLGDATYASVMPVVVTILTLLAMAVLSKLNVKGSVLWSILGGAVLYYAFMGLGCAWGDETCLAVFSGIGSSWESPLKAFSDWGTESFAKVFTEGFNFAPFIEAHGVADFILLLLTSALALCMVDMFDTMGTLYGACARGNMLDKDGNVPNMNRAMLSDAIATCTGAICGTSTVTTFVESSSGVGAGGRTGMTSVVVAICFAVAMFLSPIAKLIPSTATAAALIYVGVLMMHGVSKIDWTDASVAVPAFLTILMMPLTYNISYGIAFGLISYVIIKLCTGKAKEINVVTVVIALLFLAMFLLTH